MNPEFVRLLVQSEPRVFAFIHAHIPHRSDVEDVFQQTVMVLWTKFDQFTLGTDFLSWALSVASFEVRMFYRKQDQQKRLFSEAFLDLVSQSAGAMSEEFNDLKDALAACLEKLKDADREVVRLYYDSGATIESVAVELNRPMETIRNVLKRSRRALYECVRRTLARESR